MKNVSAIILILVLVIAAIFFYYKTKPKSKEKIEEENLAKYNEYLQEQGIKQEQNNISNICPDNLDMWFSLNLKSNGTVIIISNGELKPTKIGSLKIYFEQNPEYFVKGNKLLLSNIKDTKNYKLSNSGSIFSGKMLNGWYIIAKREYTTTDCVSKTTPLKDLIHF